MAVAVEQHFAMQFWRVIVLRLFVDEIAQRETKPLQSFGSLIVGKDFGELIAEDRPAASLQNDDRNAVANVGPQLVDQIKQPAAGHIEKAVIIERAAATDILHWHGDMEARVFEHLNRRL